MNAQISDVAFQNIRDCVYKSTGIIIGPNKACLVTSRLWRRLELGNFATYDAYYAFVCSPAGTQERNIMLDLLTTNETYFFREPAHFNFLRNHIIPQHKGDKLRIWCAASSSGQETYSLGMVLEDQLGSGKWEVLGTDISSIMLEQARKGIYQAERLDNMPDDYLKRFCRRGIGECDGKISMAPEVRSSVRFESHNLLQPRRQQEQYDVIFLRNVLIYFDVATKCKVIENVLQSLRPGGYLIVGHCESLLGMNLPINVHSPSIYRKGAAVARYMPEKIAV